MVAKVSTSRAVHTHKEKMGTGGKKESTQNFSLKINVSERPQQPHLTSFKVIQIPLNKNKKG